MAAKPHSPGLHHPPASPPSFRIGGCSEHSCRCLKGRAPRRPGLRGSGLPGPCAPKVKSILARGPSPKSEGSNLALPCFLCKNLVEVAMQSSWAPQRAQTAARLRWGGCRRLSCRGGRGVRKKAQGLCRLFSEILFHPSSIPWGARQKQRDQKTLLLLSSTCSLISSFHTGVLTWDPWIGP